MRRQERGQALSELADMDALAQAYAQDGAVVVRGLLSADELELLHEGVSRNLAAPGPLAAVASPSDDPGEFFEDFCNYDRIAEYRDLVARSRMAEAAGRLMRSSVVRFYHDHLLIKSAGTRQPTPWHQDQPYYNIDGRQTCSVWTPLDPVPEAATLKFVAGSHLGPWLMPVSFLTKEAKWFPEGALSPLPDIDAEPDRHRILKWALEPGDAVFFHMLTLHASAGSAVRRRVLSLRFTGDDVVHAPRRWKTSPEFSGLAETLPAGAPLDHPLFPVVWTSSPPS